MASFRTAKDLEKRYRVSASSLLAYAQRGNLALVRRGGVLYFDEATVARLFRSRQQQDGGGAAPAQSLGVLGACHLGERVAGGGLSGARSGC
jgi:hypothetical protein